MSLKSRKSGGVLAVKYVILTDAACDLDPGVLKTADLAVIPMEYIQQQETRTYDPAENCDLKSFYDAQRNGDLTKTSQIAPRTYEKVTPPVRRPAWRAKSSMSCTRTCR